MCRMDHVPSHIARSRYGHRRFAVNDQEEFQLPPVTPTRASAVVNDEILARQ